MENDTAIPEPEAEPEPHLGTCFQVTTTTIAALVITVGTIGNILVVLVVARMSIGRTVTDIFLASLAVADLLVCLACTPLLIVGVLRLNGHTGIHFKVEQILFYFSSVASILNLTAISIDRYDAVINATKRRLTTTIAYQLLVIIWATSALVALIIFLIPPKTEFGVLALVFVAPFITMVCIYRATLKKTRQVAKVATAGSKKSLSYRMDKTVRMVIIILVVFVVSWVPSLISRLLKYVLAHKASATSLSRMEVAACLIAYTGSALNFLVYAVMSRKFKMELYKLLGLSKYINRRVQSDNHSSMDIGKTQVVPAKSEDRTL
ncbi:Growth hormone secretagogue receptor type 1 [Holothuria leucospilota]|uniref:Growth hormone secretagogue receptor type 1 n=1 Tax=Holothuria leucospilota TaxID=206669 RepID=A0A9Q0YHI9_HOLLE|nr:Growth hormone secretagogue receptor type 1 [Holothuria leucospilota]